MRRVLKFAGFFLLTLLVVIPGCVLLNLSDPPIDDSDLRVERGDAGVPENGLHRLDEITAMVWWPEDKEDALEGLRRGDSWDQPLAEEALERNQSALAALPELIVLPILELDFPQEKLTDVEQIPVYRPLIRDRIARVLAVQAGNEARQGDASASLDASLQAIRLGDRIQRARSSTLLNDMTAIATKSIGLASIEANLKYNVVSAYDSLRVEAALIALESDAGARAAMWATEYESFEHMIDSTAESPDALRGGGEGGKPLKDAPYVYKRNETMALFADYYRHAQRNTTIPCEAHAAYPIPEWDVNEQFRTIFWPNSVGKILFRIAAVEIGRFESRRCSSDTRLAATAAMVALRAYQIDHGKLPETLDSLRPRYLLALPIDAFDGSPISYDLDARTLGEVRPKFDQSRAPSQFVVPMF